MYPRGAPRLRVEIPYKVGLKGPRYWELLEGHTLTLTHLTYWEDPYEAFILRGGLTFSDGDGMEEKDLYEKFKNVYGQSWTRCDCDSDILWRAMGGRAGHPIVRVKVHLLRLLMEVQMIASAPCENT